MSILEIFLLLFLHHHVVGIVDVEVGHEVKLKRMGDDDGL
jgi:hypothetical protein